MPSPPARRAAVLAVLLVATLVSASATGSPVRPGSATVPVASLTIDQRVEQLLARMTLEEKARQLYGVERPPGVHSAGYVPGNARLGIPPTVLSDGPAGLKDRMTASVHRPATALPAPLGMAATFDPTVARRYGALLGKEARARGVDVLYAPTVNIVRTPQGGRNFEFLGEDPHLTSAIAVPEVQGLQGWGVAAQVKHFAANSQEALRATSSSDVDERTLRQIYLPAFHATTTRGGAWSVMCAFNKVNGVHSCENAQLLARILKGDWGFRGFVGSDYPATHERSPWRGMDQSFTPGDWGVFYRDLPALVRSGAISEAVVDDHVRRVLRAMFAIGMFDPGRTRPVVDVAAHGAVARQVAEQSAVLLRNANGILPLRTESLRSIAVIGSYADRAHPGGGGSAHVDPYYTVSPVAGIRARAGAAVTVTTADGSDVTAAARLAGAADVAVVVAHDVSGEGRDRPSIALPDDQDALVSAVARANPRTVVVLNTGGPVTMPWVAQVPGLLQMWYPGQENGSALASLLFGDVNPAGKLPVTFPVSLARSPIDGPPRYPAVDGRYRYTEGLRVGYRWYDATATAPLFPFGFGLSYTTFGFERLAVTQNADRSLSVGVTVTNTGGRRGATVAQVYVGFPVTAGEPPRQLKAFRKVTLDPGESRRLSMRVAASDLRIWDVAGDRWTSPSGSYRVWVGESSRSLPLSQTVTR